MIKLKYNQHIVNRNLGQNFLIDSDVIRNLINSINPKKTDTMIEIGPGLGELTTHIHKFLNKLFIIEYDKHLASRLFLSFRNVSSIKIFVQDVLKFNFSCIEKRNYDSIRLFGNLPYNISVILLLHLFKYDNIFDMHFMFQREVANRLIALPGTKSYGRLSIISQYHCKIIRLFDVYPRSFRPIPKVNSTFLRLVPYKNQEYYVKNIHILEQVTALAFNKRRKMIKHSLSELFSENILIKLKVNPRLRAENLSITQYCILSNYIS